MTVLLTPRYVHKSPLSLEARVLLAQVALDMPDANGNPNRYPWRGVLTQIDAPSTRAPNGAKGHRVLIPRAVAEEALPSLMGMPVNVAGDQRDHAKQHIIGVITSATIEGKDLVVAGHLFHKNVPEKVEEVHDNTSQLGMSFEIGDVLVEDDQAPIWTLQHLIFTGAAILEKTAAAYQDTAIAANATEDPLMAEDAKAILEELGKMGLKLDELAAAGEEDAAKSEEDAAAKEAVAAAKAEEDAAVAVKAKADADAKKAAADAEEDEEEDAAADMPALFAMLLKSMHRGKMKAAAKSDDDDEDAMAATIGRVMLKAMAYPGGAGPVAKRKAADAAEHNDEAEDTALFKRLMQRYGKMDAGGDVIGLEARRTRRQLRDIQAAMELITDTLKKQSGLITDLVQKQKALATDGSPARKTMAATGLERFVGPFDAAEAGDHSFAHVSLDQINAALDKSGQPVGEQHNVNRMAKKIEALSTGVLKTN